MTLHPVVKVILEAVRDRAVNARTRDLAIDLLRREEEHQAELERARAARAERPKKKLGGATEHHAKERRQEERQAEAVADGTWALVLIRTQQDHRVPYLCCEACHKPRELEPHHLVLGSRTDAPELVMALCRDCHTLAPDSAHRAPRGFAVRVVIPWARKHGLSLPHRKEYRDA